MVRTSPCSAEGEGSIPFQELRSHMPHGQRTNQNIKQKQYGNGFNKDFINVPLKKILEKPS